MGGECRADARLSRRFSTPVDSSDMKTVVTTAKTVMFAPVLGPC